MHFISVSYRGFHWVKNIQNLNRTESYVILLYFIVGITDSFWYRILSAVK